MKHEFDHLLPPGQTWFSPKEVAAVIGTTDQFVRDCFQNRKILGHQTNGRSRKTKEQQRQRYLIHREGVLLYLSQTANYEAGDFLALMKQLVRERPMEERRALRAALED